MAILLIDSWPNRKDLVGKYMVKDRIRGVEVLDSDRQMGLKEGFTLIKICPFIRSSGMHTLFYRPGPRDSVMNRRIHSLRYDSPVRALAPLKWPCVWKCRDTGLSGLDRATSREHVKEDMGKRSLVVACGLPASSSHPWKVPSWLFGDSHTAVCPPSRKCSHLQLPDYSKVTSIPQMGFVGPFPLTIIANGIEPSVYSGHHSKWFSCIGSRNILTSTPWARSCAVLFIPILQMKVEK